MNVLYVGPDYPGSNGTCWRDAFVALGHTVRTVNSERLCKWPSTVPDRVVARVRKAPPANLTASLNGSIVSAIREFRPDLTFFVQARFVAAETVEEANRAGRTVVYCNDDMYNVRNQTHTFFDVVRSVGCILTTKSFNVAEFKRDGARNVLFLPNAYDPNCHFPAGLNEEQRARLRGDIAFIGTFRPERADFLGQMAARVGSCSLNIWGGGWTKMRRPIYWMSRGRWRAVSDSLRGSELWCVDMGRAIQANKIVLGLLCHINRDLHTSRSFEIPACGGFMLAERTTEHSEYFCEDREAVYFSSLDELVDKARHFVQNDAARRRIADAAYRRCLTSGYRYVDRAATLLASINN